MTIFIFANNVNTTLAGAVSPSATTITLASTANLPATIPAGAVLVITLNDVATKQNFEVLYATARTGATLTVSRAQEGTAALAWLTGDYAYSPPTAGQQGAFGQLGANNAWSGPNTFSDPVGVGNPVSPGQALNEASGDIRYVMHGSAALAGTQANIGWTPSGASSDVRSVTFIAPCNGLAIARSIVNSNAGQTTSIGNVASVNGVAGGSENIIGSSTVSTVASVTAGSSVTVAATASVTSGTSIPASHWLEYQFMPS